MESGSIKFFNDKNGWGFIKPDSGSADIFVHIRDIRQSGLQTLAENQKITFDTAPGKEGKGPKAINIAVAPQCPT